MNVDPGVTGDALTLLVSCRSLCGAPTAGAGAGTLLLLPAAGSLVLLDTDATLRMSVPSPV